jgi:hypothetical protein
MWQGDQEAGQSVQLTATDCGSLKPANPGFIALPEAFVLKETPAIPAGVSFLSVVSCFAAREGGGWSLNRSAVRRSSFGRRKRSSRWQAPASGTPPAGHGIFRSREKAECRNATG